jgi:cell division protein FtsA
MSLHRLGRRRGARDGGNIVAALDIGTYKIACVVAEHLPVYAHGGTARQQVRLVGIGHQRSQGIHAGAVVDLRQAQAAVAAALAQAEQAAGVRIDEVVLGVGCGGPRSRTFNGHVELADGIVGGADVGRLEAGARAYAVREGRALVSLNRISFGLDATTGIRDPIGLAGRRLEANHHAVTVDAGALRNLCLLVESCQVRPRRLLNAGYASAVAATSEAERWAGVACIDIGCGLVSIAGFVEGHLVYSASIPLGGQQVTQELAQGLEVTLAEAERIKTLYGSLVTSASDAHDVIPLSRETAWGEDTAVVARALIWQAIAGGMQRLLLQVSACLAACPIERVRSGGVVLTGGGAEVPGLDEFAAAQLGRSVRIGSPPRFEGGAARASGGVASPAFACVAGLVMAMPLAPTWIDIGAESTPDRPGYLGRVERWLRESF